MTKKIFFKALAVNYRLFWICLYDNLVYISSICSSVSVLDVLLVVLQDVLVGGREPGVEPLHLVLVDLLGLGVRDEVGEVVHDLGARQEQQQLLEGPERPGGRAHLVQEQRLAGQLVAVFITRYIPMSACFSFSFLSLAWSPKKYSLAPVTMHSSGM